MLLTRGKRWRVRYPVQVACQDFIDEAWTVNVSLQGLSLETVQPIQVGSQLYVRVLLPSGASSVDYEICTVQWAADGKIGLKTSEMSTAEERRLHRHLASLSVLGETGGWRAPTVPAAEPRSQRIERAGLLQRLVKPLIRTTRGAQRFAVSARKILPR